MGRLIALLSGGSGTFWLIGAVLVIGAAGGAAGYKARGVIDAPVIARAETAAAQAGERTAQCQADHEAGRAKSAEQAVEALTAAAGDVTAAMGALAKQAGARDAATSRFLKDLANVPKTSICAGSPADLAYRRSVQPQGSGSAATP